MIEGFRWDIEVETAGSQPADTAATPVTEVIETVTTTATRLPPWPVVIGVLALIGAAVYYFRK